MTQADTIAEFEEITNMMTGSPVTLTDLVRIPDHPELVHAKILDEGKRRLVLEKAKTLKGSRYDGVFIRRDLTYAQRHELKIRRERQPQETARMPQRGQGPVQPVDQGEGGHQPSAERQENHGVSDLEHDTQNR